MHRVKRDCNLVYAPPEDDEVEELCEGDEGDEAGRGVVGQHDRDEHERPHEEPQRELCPSSQCCSQWFQGGANRTGKCRKIYK